jgi:hypothetical protein
MYFPPHATTINQLNLDNFLCHVTDTVLKNDKDKSEIGFIVHDISSIFSYLFLLKDILQRTPFTQVFTDASGTGWGIVCGNRHFSGLWSPQERGFHISYKEPLVVDKTLQQVPLSHSEHVQLCMDNTSTLVYINKFCSTRSFSLTTLAVDI